MSQENVEIVRAIYDAFASGEVAAALARMRPDIVWNEAENHPYAEGNPYRGPQAVLGLFGRITEEWEGFTVVCNKYLDAGECVIMLGRYRGTYKSTGRAQNCQVVHVWRVEDGQAASFQQYVDTLQVARVIGRG